MSDGWTNEQSGTSRYGWTIVTLMPRADTVGSFNEGASKWVLEPIFEF